MTPPPDHQPFRLIVAGSRTFQGYGLLCRTLDRLLCARLPHVVILSGGARGADALGERYAAERGLAVERHPADWRAHGRAAGPVRNGQMVAVAQGLAAFWDGSSRGTRDVIDQARNAGLAIRVVVVQDGG